MRTPAPLLSFIEFACVLKVSYSYSYWIDKGAKVRISRILCLITSLIVLAGCSPLPERIDVKPVKDETTPSIVGTNDVLIFGRVTVLVNGELTEPWWNLFGTGALLSFWQVSLSSPDLSKNDLDKTAYASFESEKNGAFRAIVPAGRYLLTRAMLFSECLITMKLATDVSVPGNAYYLGDLIVDVDGWSFLNKSCYRLNYFEIADNFNEARSELPVKSLDTWASSTEKQLLRRVPASFESSSGGPVGGGGFTGGSIRFGK
jgi:hypothetical protein